MNGQTETPPVRSEPARVLDPVGATFDEGGFLAQRFDGYQPRPGQISLARAIHRAITDVDHVIAEGPCGCHVAGQKLLMHDGSIRSVEEVIVGDKLMGPDSKPRTVLALARGREAIVEVRPVKGAPWRVNRSHVLTLMRTDNDKVRDISIPDFLRESMTQKHLAKLFRVGVDFGDTTDLQIDPYHLGVLLGDGGMTAGSVGITKPGPLIRRVAQEIAEQFNLTIRTDRQEGGCPTHYIVKKDDLVRRNPLISALREIGLYGCGSRTKFIPSSYRLASAEDRLLILAGLMDTDGSKTNNCFDIVLASKQLIDDITFVARSVGLAAYPKPCIKSAGEGHSDTYYRVCISGDTDRIPCRDLAKKCEPRRQIKSVLRTGFEIIDCGYDDDYFGFTLDGDGRYLLDDFTVTHNTGKTFSYLVPAIYESSMGGIRTFDCHRCKGTGQTNYGGVPQSCSECNARGKVDRRVRVVVATANIALQEQLVEKDLPRLREILPWDFSWTIFKGKGNYLCVDRHNKLLGAQAQGSLPGMRASTVEDETPELRKLLTWARETETGDKSELDFVPTTQSWGKLSVSADDCKGRKCRQFKACHAVAARSRAAESNIIICNYHILFSHLKFGGTVLPPFDVVILDEAHETANIARDFFGFEMNGWSFKRLSRFLEKRRKTDVAKTVEAEGIAFFEALKSYATSDAYNIRIRKPDAVPRGKVIKALDEAEDVMREMQSQAVGEDAKADVEIECKRAKKMRDTIEVALSLEIDNLVSFIDIDKNRGHVSLKGKPIDVSHQLKTKLFHPTPTVILASATLSTNGNFDWIESEVGIQEPQRIIVPSPFLPSQQLFIIPRVPDPRDNEFQDAVVDTIVSVIQQARGRTLCLFTSYRMLHHAHREVSERVDQAYLFKQGDKPRTQLVDDFRRDVDSCLFGTTSFWAGVDVPGESLSALVIDKLPFPSPMDPVLDAIGERLKNKSFMSGAFMQHSIPRAAIMFKQGFGRLIRATSDRGVVVCCDKRIVTKGYGKVFTRCIPGVELSRDLDDVHRFLGTEPLHLVEEDIPF